MKKSGDTKEWPLGYGIELKESKRRYDVAAINTELPEWKYNARLIAAAPELLEACKEMAQWHDLIKQNYPEMISLISGMENARAAIAKAEGAI
jgi:hypothetical protein